MWDLRIRILLELLLTHSHSLGQVALGLPDFCRGEHPPPAPRHLELVLSEHVRREEPGR